MIDVTDIVVSALGSAGIVVDESWIDLSELSVILDIDTLLSQNSSALSFGCLKIYVLRVMDNLSA